MNTTNNVIIIVSGLLVLVLVELFFTAINQTPALAIGVSNSTITPRHWKYDDDHTHVVANEPLYVNNTVMKNLTDTYNHFKATYGTRDNRTIIALANYRLATCANEANAAQDRISEKALLANKTYAGKPYEYIHNLASDLFGKWLSDKKFNNCDAAVLYDYEHRVYSTLWFYLEANGYLHSRAKLTLGTEYEKIQ